MPAPNQSPAHLSDEALVDMARSGDASALAQLYRRYVGEVYGFAMNNLGGSQDAEDVTSATFTKVVDSLASFRGEATFRTWLYAIARNQLRDHWRHNGQVRPVGLEEVRLASTDTAAPATNPRWSRLGEAVMARLPVNYREVLSLRILQERSVRETAAALATTEGNVKVLQHRALRRAAAIARELGADDDH